MPNRSKTEKTETTNPIPPDRHHGGQELPDDVQDRPEQNAGYDAAVRGEEEETEDVDLTDLEQLDQEEDVELDDDLPR